MRKTDLVRICARICACALVAMLTTMGMGAVFPQLAGGWPSALFFTIMYLNLLVYSETLLT